MGHMLVRFCGILLLLPAPQLVGGELEDRLLALASDHPGTVAIAVKHLESGESLYLNADQVLPTASLIKFPVMLEFYMQVLEGKLNLDDRVTLTDDAKVPGSGILTYHFTAGATFSLRDAVRLMIVFSDNTATNLVLDRMGVAAIGKRMAAWGFPNTKIHAQVFKGATTSIDQEGTKKYGLGRTTAREMVGLLEKLKQGVLVSPAACAEMVGHMKKCEDATKIKRLLPDNIVVANKSGSVESVKTDAGIMYLSGGPVAICVLTANNDDKSFKADNNANILIGRIAREVHDYFTRKRDVK